VRPIESTLKIFVIKWIECKLVMTLLITGEDFSTFIRPESFKSYMKRIKLLIAGLKYEIFIVRMTDGLGN
jgi:hypothetical protein